METKEWGPRNGDKEKRAKIKGRRNGKHLIDTGETMMKKWTQRNSDKWFVPDESDKFMGRIRGKERMAMNKDVQTDGDEKGERTSVKNGLYRREGVCQKKNT